MEGYQTAKWDDGTWAITACYPTFPWGDQILTEQMSYRVFWFSFTSQLMTGDKVTLLFHICWLVNLNSNWAHFSSIHKGLSRAGLSDNGSSEGTPEEKEPLDTSPASSWSPGLTVARTLFDVIHLRGLELIVFESGTPRPPTHTTQRWLW